MLWIDVWHDDYDEARAIVVQVKEAFDGVTLELSASGRIARLRHVADSVRQHADGLWQWTADWEARICLLP